MKPCLFIPVPSSRDKATFIPTLKSLFISHLLRGYKQEFLCYYLFFSQCMNSHLNYYSLKKKCLQVKGIFEMHNPYTLPVSSLSKLAYL